MSRLRILGAPVDALTMAGALSYIDHYLATATHPGYVLAVNPEKVYKLQESSFLQAFFDKAALLIPDGIGIVLAARWLHGATLSRVAGADLMQSICAAAPQKGYRIFIYGSSEAVNRQAVEKLQQRYPGIQIVGRANGYVPEEQMADLVAQINDSGADILFVALGSPRQEQWIGEHLPELRVKLCQGIGGTLDTIAGTVKRAPVIYQRLGLEWFYRLLQQPSRIMRMRVLPLFLYEVLCDKLKSRRAWKGRHA